MKEVNFWDTNYYRDNYIFIDKEKLKDEMKKLNIIVIDSIIPNKIIEYPGIYPVLEKKVKQLQIILNYTSEAHPIIRQKEGNKVLLNPDYLYKNKDELLKVYYEKLVNLENSLVIIERQFFDNERFNKLIKQNKTLYFKLKINNDILSEENKNYLIKNFIGCTTNQSVISNRFFISNYDISYMKKKQILKLNYKDINNENIKYIKPGSTIYLETEEDENTNLYNYSKLCSILENKKITTRVIIDENLLNELLFKIDFKTIKYEYVILIIKEDMEYYTVNEYLNSNSYFEDLVKNIKNSKTSLFEKYVQLFSIINKYKPSKTRTDRQNISKTFTHFLRKMLIQLGINSYPLKEGKLLIYLQDFKYDIDGYYIVNTWWDDFIYQDNYYGKSALTFKEDYEKNDINTIFSASKMSEFSNNINKLIDKKIKEKQNTVLIPTQLSLKSEKGHIKHSRYQHIFEKEAIYDIYKLSMKIIRKLDYNNYEKLINSFSFTNPITVDINKYYDFLSQLGSYIIKHNNKKIYKEHFMTASVCMKIRTSDQKKTEQIKTIINNIN